MASDRGHQATPPSLDPQVLAAQRHNAGRMTDKQLLKELHRVSRFPEQPPIRVAYLSTLSEERSRRGL